MTMLSKNQKPPTAAESRHMERRTIPGYEGRFEADEAGQIYSLDRLLVDALGRTRRMKGKPLKPASDMAGYQFVSLEGNPRYVHRLVCAAFCGSPSGGKQVNHKDGRKKNNSASNLEWVTASENNLHAFRVLKRKAGKSMLGRFGSEHNRSVAVVGLDRITKEVRRRFGSMHEAGRAGFRPTCICACVNGRQKSHRGYLWAVAK